MSTSASSVVRPGKSRRLTSKVILWMVLCLVAVWVFFSNELALLFDYPLYRAYRAVMISDRLLLIPHAVCGLFALVSGPFQFSTRLRQHNLPLHRLLGRLYVFAVYGAALSAFFISWHRPLFPGTVTQGGTWIIVTTLAWVTAMNGHIAVHRQWIARSYAVTFTFVTLRIFSVWPAYWNLSDEWSVLIIIMVTLGSVLAADIILNWREITRRRV